MIRLAAWVLAGAAFLAAVVWLVERSQQPAPAASALGSAPAPAPPAAAARSDSPFGPAPDRELTPPAVAPPVAAKASAPASAAQDTPQAGFIAGMNPPRVSDAEAAENNKRFRESAGRPMALPSK